MPEAAAGWRRYLGPAAFLLVVTIAVVLVRSGLEHRHPAAQPPSPTVPAARTDPVATTTRTVKKHAPAKRFWTVQAGDTFGVIATKAGVPVATIQQLNPTISSTALFIGEKVRIR